MTPASRAGLLAVGRRLCYKRGMILRPLIPAVLALAAVCVAAEDFSRYGVILTRKPFGEEVVPVAPTNGPVVPPGESVVNKVKMTAVVRAEDGTLKVGIVDLKSNRNYLLDIGESLDGMEVVSADYEKERARLRRGPEDYWVSMYGGSNKFEVAGREAAPAVPAPVAPGVAASPAAPAVLAGRRPLGVAKASLAGTRGDRDQRMSYALRRLQRDAARRHAEEAAAGEGRSTNAPAAVVRAGQVTPSARDAGNTEVMRIMESLTNQVELSEAEVAQLLQEYQKTLIRGGQTPLPIPLSPETDAQLVEEGYLPAQP